MELFITSSVSCAICLLLFWVILPLVLPRLVTSFNEGLTSLEIKVSLTYNYLIITIIKHVIHQRRKQGKEMTVADVKRCRLGNISIVEAKDILSDK